MKSRIPVRIALAWCVIAATPAFAGEAIGTWLRESGASHVKIAPCGGGALCGTFTWIKPGTDAWKGSAFNPEDGQTYAGKMSLSGSTLTTAGCALGGMICKSTSWTRVN